ncbi:OprO/OprP family phosphate-selective porin [Methylotenera sp.]|uniref:OprO/OprP family phosphate-selective porin n=1 Tax=Methylotenera sp. TaxID=2051956 RepID=UPI002730C5D8|nr:porin [Methylotenera sp.]MDP2231214.1 porin [Methylotenera sp.]MDP3140060.1 porin [Methylotenera sp.]
MNGNKLRGVIAAVAGVMMFNAMPAMADSTDDILNALIAKGVLTEEEGALLQKGRAGEKEAAAKKKESAISASFKDGIVFESGDKKHKMSINGRAQLDYRSFNNENSTNQADTFDIRRAYLGVKGTIYDTYDYEVTYNGANVSGSDLLYAYFNARYWDAAQLKLGQFKQPFSMEELGSSRFTNFTERSMVTQLVPAIDRGIQIHGVPTKGLTYAVGAFNGVGVNGGTATNDTFGGNTVAVAGNPATPVVAVPAVSASASDGKSYTGRVTANIAEFMGNKDAVFHLGAAYSKSTENSNTSAIAIRSEGRGTNVFATQAFTALSATNKGYDLNRTGLEAAVAYGPFKFQSEYVKAEFEPDGNTALVTGAVAGKSYDVNAWYAAVNWNITGESYADVYKNGLFGGRLKPKSEFSPSEGKYGWGAWEIGARYSKLDAKDFGSAQTNRVFITPGSSTNNVSKFNEADAITLGLKWIPSPNVRYMLNYVMTDMDCVAGVACTNDEEKAVNLRAQIDF